MSLLRNRRAELLAAAVTLGIVISFFLLPRSTEGVEITFIDPPSCSPIVVGQACNLTATINIPAGQFVSSIRFGATGPGTIFDVLIPLKSGSFPSDLISEADGELTGSVTLAGGASGYGYGFVGYGYGYGYGVPDGGDILLVLNYKPVSAGTYTAVITAISSVVGGSGLKKQEQADIVVNPASSGGGSGGGGGGAAIPTATPTVMPVDSDGGVVAIVESDEATTLSLGEVTLVVPACPLDAPTQVRLRSLAAVSLDDQPDGDVLSALDIEFFDTHADLIQDLVLCEDADLTIALTDDDVEDLGGSQRFDEEASAGRIVIQRLESTGWTTLPTNADISSRSFTTALRKFSVFALVAKEAPEPKPTPVPPGGAPPTASPPAPTATAPAPTATAAAEPSATATQIPPVPTSTAMPASTPPPPPAAAPPPAARVPAPTVAATPAPPSVAVAATAPTPRPTAVAPAPVVEDVSSGVPFWIWLMLGFGVLLIGVSLLRAYRLYYQSD